MGGIFVKKKSAETNAIFQSLCNNNIYSSNVRINDSSQNYMKKFQLLLGR